MVNRLILSLFIALLMYGVPTDAQMRRSPGHEERSGVQRLRQYKKIKIIEILRLNEEEAVRFFARQNIHEENIGALMEQRDQSLNTLKKNIDDGGDVKDVQLLTDDVLVVDDKICRERRRYQDEQRKALTSEQFAKFLGFEREFGTQLRDAAEGLWRDRRERRDRRD